jgi:hypothetical protein
MPDGYIKVHSRPAGEEKKDILVTNRKQGRFSSCTGHGRRLSTGKVRDCVAQWADCVVSQLWGGGGSLAGVGMGGA